MSALGDEFRSAREARGLTLSDVAEQIHIRSVYLNAIENEDWQSIGAPVYVRGFIRTYARFLALESEAAVAQFNQTIPAERPAPANLPIQDERERSGPSPWALIGVVIALALSGFAGYEWWSFSQGNSAGTVSVATAAPAPSVTPVAQPAAPPAGSQAASPAPTALPNLHHALEIRLTQRSWLRVSVDGATQLEGIYPAGTVRTFTGKLADVRVGNAGGVTITVDRRPPAPLGKEGDVVEHHFVL
jgi:cytoskeletal protein RodZ